MYSVGFFTTTMVKFVFLWSTLTKHAEWTITFQRRGAGPKKNPAQQKLLKKTLAGEVAQRNNFKEVLSGVIILIFDVKKILGQAFAQWEKMQPQFKENIMVPS